MQSGKNEGGELLNEMIVSLFHEILEIEELAVQQAAGVSLSVTEIHTLVAIGEEQRHMTAVAEALGITISTLTVAVNKLLQKGYVEKQRNEEDRRIVDVRLSPRGKVMVAAHDRFHRHMVSAALQGLCGDEAAALFKGVRNLQAFFLEEKKRCLRKIHRGEAFQK